MALDRDPQAVKFVKPDILYRTSLSVREDRGLSDKLRAGLLERAEIVEARISASMGAAFDELEKRPGAAECSDSGPRRAQPRCPLYPDEPT